MENPAKGALDKERIKSFAFKDGLSPRRDSQPEKFGPRLLEAEGRDDPFILALKLKIAALEQEKTSLQQKNTSLLQDASRKQNMLVNRQLLNDFINNYPGNQIDRNLMNWIRNKYPNFDRKYTYDIMTFSIMVKSLVEKKSKLQKDDPNLTKDLLGEINSRLSNLQAYAKAFQDPEMRWDKAIGNGFYNLCLLAADANEMCHPNMSEERLKDMGTNAGKGEYKYKGEELGPAIQAIIRIKVVYDKANQGASSS